VLPRSRTTISVVRRIAWSRSHGFEISAGSQSGKISRRDAEGEYWLYTLVEQKYRL